MGQVFFGDIVTRDPFRYNVSDQTLGYRPSPVHLNRES